MRNATARSSVTAITRPSWEQGVAVLSMLIVFALFAWRYDTDKIIGYPGVDTPGMPLTSDYWPPAESLKLERIPGMLMSGEAATGIGLSEQAKQVMERRFDLMEEWSGVLDANLKLQIAFVIVALLVLFSAERTFKVPVFDLELPVSWLQVIIPFALVFLWFRFGFALHNSIDNRVLLDLLVRHSIPEQWNDDLVHSARRLVRDGAFGDAWFAAFRKEFFLMDGDKPSAVHFMQIIFYAIVIGLSHACVLALIVNRAAYVRKTLLARCVHTGMLVIAAVWFHVSHHQFHWGGPQPNWMQRLILAVAVVGLILLIWKSRIPEQRPRHTSSNPEGQVAWLWLGTAVPSTHLASADLATNECGQGGADDVPRAARGSGRDTRADPP